MRKLVIVPNNLGSRSAKYLAEVLSEKLGYKVWRVTPGRVGRRIPFTLRAGTDKLTQFRTYQNAGVSIPEFTTERIVAENWLRDGDTVLARTMLHGSEGRGIVVMEPGGPFTEAPLYTKYVKKKKEFRVHVLFGQVIDVQEKRKKANYDGQRDSRIRNVANGYVFCRDNITEPQQLRELSVRATNALGYQLGAVDVVYNEHHGRCYVLEVNSTPGMEGTTLQSYANAIVSWCKDQ